MARYTEMQAPVPTNEPVAFDDRIRRVMELKNQVRQGTYRLDAEAVAKAILGEWIAVGDVVAGNEFAPAVETAAERKSVGARFVVAREAARTDSVATVMRSA